MAIRLCSVEGCNELFVTYGAGRFCILHRKTVPAHIRAARAKAAKRSKDKNREAVNAAQNAKRASSREAYNAEQREKYRENAEARRNRFIMKKYGYATIEEAERHRAAFHLRHRRDVDQLSKECYELGY